jgi:hypothetical protein
MGHCGIERIIVEPAPIGFHHETKIPGGLGTFGLARVAAATCGSCHRRMIAPIGMIDGFGYLPTEGW